MQDQVTIQPLGRPADRLPATSVPQATTRVRQLKHMIGNTPLLRIRCLFRGQERVIHAKAEHLNLTGSIKDRMAFHILKQAYQEELFNQVTRLPKLPAVIRGSHLPPLAAPWAIKS